MNAKLSVAQADVVEKMQAGNELSRNFHGDYRITTEQGFTMKIDRRTAMALYESKIIQCDLPLAPKKVIFSLTDLGKSIKVWPTRT